MVPQGEEILICGFGLGGVALQRAGASEAEMGECGDGLVYDDARVVEDFLELGGGFVPLTRGQVGFATDKNRIHGAPVEWTVGRDSKLIGFGDSEILDCLNSLSFVECKPCAEGRQVIELHDGIFGEPPVQIVDQRLRSCVLARIRECQCRKIQHIAI